MPCSWEYGLPFCYLFQKLQYVDIHICRFSHGSQWQYFCFPPFFLLLRSMSPFSPFICIVSFFSSPLLSCLLLSLPWSRQQKYSTKGGHRYWTLYIANIQYAILSFSVWYRIIPISDHSEIGLSFDIRYWIEYSNTTFADIGIIQYPKFRIIDWCNTYQKNKPNSRNKSM